MKKTPIRFIATILAVVPLLQSCAGLIGEDRRTSATVRWIASVARLRRGGGIRSWRPAARAAQAAARGHRRQTGRAGVQIVAPSSMSASL